MTAPTNDRRELLTAVLAEHESLLGSDDYTSCVCGAETVNLGGLRAHVAAALDAALAAQEGEPALIHARWHRALDNPAREDTGPIRDHIQQHDAEVLAPIRDFHERWGSADVDDLDHLALWEELNELLGEQP